MDLNHIAADAIGMSGFFHGLWHKHPEIQIAMVTTSYRADAPGLVIECFHEEDAAKIGALVEADRRRCECCGNEAYVKHIDEGPFGRFEVIVNWVTEDIPDYIPEHFLEG